MTLPANRQPLNNIWFGIAVGVALVFLGNVLI